MTPSHKTLLVFILILIAGLIPVSIYLMERSNDSLDISIASLPRRNLTLFEQGAQALAGLVLKPVYMMLSLLIIIFLIGHKSVDISALQCGQIAFLAGETFCAINFYVFKHESILSEYLHSYGMALAFGFTSFALLEGLDTRLLRRTSYYARDARTVAQYVIIILGVLTFLPMLAPLQSDAYAVSIFGYPYSYTRFDVYELYERRVLPAFGLTAFVISYLSMLGEDGPSIPFIAKIFLCAGLGALGFSLFRVSLNAIFVNDLVWFEFWEEATELMFVGSIGFVLWKFKRTLLEKTPVLENLGFMV
jgi:hypothetical protein